MKNFFIIFVLTAFSTSVVAETIIMKCKKYRYKYVSDGTEVTVFSANIKRDKKNYHKFCPAEVNESNKHFLKSIEGVELVISEYQAICFTKKATFINGGIGTDSTSVTDFKKLKRSSNYKWNGTKQTQREKCKLENR